MNNIKGLFNKNKESGVILPLLLGILALGGLIITSSLRYATTNLESQKRVNELTKGSYAADAGIEQALWSLQGGGQPPQQLTGTVNGMNVSLDTVSQGTYVLYLGQLIQPSVHNNYLDVQTDIMWDQQQQANRFTVTITKQAGPTKIHLEQVGARLPPGYTYKTGSANPFVNNLSRNEPQISQDQFGCSMINWVFSNPLPSVTTSQPVATQTFYMNGPQTVQGGSYGWTVANSADIGAVSSLEGGLYKITATATDNRTGKITGKIETNIVMSDETYITSWQVLR